MLNHMDLILRPQNHAREFLNLYEVPQMISYCQLQTSIFQASILDIAEH